MPRIAPWLAVPFAIAALSCGAESDDFLVAGTDVAIRTSAPFAHHPEFPARLESTISASLRYWGGSWRDLAGVRIAFLDDQYLRCGEDERALGCNDGDIRVTTRDPSLGTWHCVEQTVLVHEIGHSVIGDPLHADPRWMDFGAVAEELEGRTGYDGEGERPCTLYPSVWRHLGERR